MNRLIKLCLSFLMVFSIMTITVKEEINAQDSLVGCDAYELAWVNDTGGFDTVSCHSTFEEAKKAMNQDDYVIRHASSKSPSKIIAIASGIAYSYPKRSGKLTMNIYQSSSYVNDNKYKATYVVQHRELLVPETVSYNGSGEGNVKVYLNGFEGYAKLSEMDLVPMKFITNGLKITLGGQTSDNSENPFTLIPKQSYYSVIQNGNYTDLVFHFYSGYDGSEYNLTIGQAADWMSTGAVYYSFDGYQFYADRKMTDYLATYYNYYQFLPLRSLSAIHAETFDAYLTSKGYTEKPASTSINSLTKSQSQLVNEGATFVSAQNTYGVNALMVYAMACLESSYGRSNFAVSKNNLFGWDAVDENPNNATAFSSVSSGITEHMAYNLRGYLDITDARYFGMHVGNKGSGFNVKYASDPYWGMKIASIAYDIDKFSKNYDGTTTDYGRETLGMISEFGASYLLSASSNSDILITSEYSRYYQENHTVIINGETNGYYQVQFPNAILDGNGTFLKNKVSGVLQPATPYDYEKSVAYIKQESITLLNEFNDVTIPGYEATGEFVFELDEFSLSDEGVLTVSGSAYCPGIYITESNQLIHTLAVFNQFYEKVTEVRFATELSGDSKEIAAFEGVLDLNELEDGEYYFRMYSDYSALTEYSDSREVKTDIGSISTATKIFNFDSSGEYTVMTVKTKEVPVENPDSKLIQSLDKFDYDDSTHILRIAGFAFITLMDAHESTPITHQIILRNMESGEEMVFDAETTQLSSAIEMFDGYRYLKVNYQTAIDFNQLPAGNYVFYLKVTNHSISKKAFLIDQYNDFIPEDSVLGDYLVRFTKNSIYSYRYELDIEKNQIDYKSIVNKPTRRNSGFGIDSIALTDGKLAIEGLAWIYNVNFGEENSPVQNLILMKEGGEYTSYSTQNVACKVDYTSILKTKFNWDNICFTTDLDLTDLEEGEYRMYMDVVSETYRDIFEANNLYGLPISSTVYNGRKYSIITSKVRDRMILKIEKE